MIDDKLDNEFKIRLEGMSTGLLVVFNTQPNFQTHYDANYQQTNITHLIGHFNTYESSPSSSYSLSDIKLVSRNPFEARQNLNKLLILRSWTKSYFGDTQSLSNEPDDLKGWLGSPPEVLKFSAYSNQKYGIFHNIPVVLSKVDVQYPNDLDYIVTENVEDDRLSNVPFPTIMTIGITLLEQHSAIEFEHFNLHQYRHGIMEGF